MSAPPKFCASCGEKLDTEKEMDECPKCHSALHQHSEHKKSPSRVVEQLPYKSPGTAALIAFIGGIFALPGIGHIYVGKVGKGIAILILGIVLIILTIVLIFSVVPFTMSTDEATTLENASIGIWIPIMSAVFGIAYLVLFVWQIFNARKLAKKFNESVKTTGKEPW
jgi:TM2 domain-containing membrane protein YozV